MSSSEWEGGEAPDVERVDPEELRSVPPGSADEVTAETLEEERVREWTTRPKEEAPADPDRLVEREGEDQGGI